MAWQETESGLTREFTFDRYQDGLDFVNRVGELAERLNHHPQIILDYGKVTIHSVTHDAGYTVTDRDHKLAAAIDELV